MCVLQRYGMRKLLRSTRDKRVKWKTAYQNSGRVLENIKDAQKLKHGPLKTGPGAGRGLNFNLILKWL